jgi:type II secretory pathway pseudopilin PulG
VGFTTVELLLVIVILGVVAWLVVPRFGFDVLAVEEVDTTSRRLVSGLRLARRLAISEGADHRLRLLPGSPPYHGYTIELATGNGKWQTVHGPMSMPDSVHCAGDREHRFTRLGSATAATSVTLSRAGQERRVRVLAATGRVLVEPAP